MDRKFLPGNGFYIKGFKMSQIVLSEI